MKLKFAFLNLFLGCISFLMINTKLISNAKGQELLKVELHNEIKKGKFLIGLKQYLGGKNDSFSEKKNINFTTNKGFLNLLLGCISLLIINTILISNAKGEELPKVELHNEIKKGKFLIGLKQYLGGDNDSFS